MGSAERRYELVIDTRGRPTTQNKVHNMHYREVSADRKGWREDTATLARAARIPAHAAIEVEAWGRYPDRRSLPDADAIAPAVKGAIDGLVDAGIIPDDSAAYLHGVTYRPPKINSGAPPALILVITPAPSLDGER